MKRIFLVIILLIIAATPVKAAEYTAPVAPDSVEELMPAKTESFGDGLMEILKDGIRIIQPQISAAAGTCTALVGIVMLISIMKVLPGTTAAVVDLVAVLGICTVLLQQTTAMITAATDTVWELSEYGKLLLPVMTAAMAAGGGTTSAPLLYTTTVVFDSILSGLAVKILVPLVYIFLALAVAVGATGMQRLKKLKDFIKWLMTWVLKIVLYIFTGYIGITGVVSGATDAAAVKAAKLALSGMVPVVGGILSDASEAVLVGSGIVKNAAGIYGMLAIIAIVVAPFLKIGVQYLLLKLTAAVCSAFECKTATELIDSFSGAMGLLLGMTGAMCVMLLVSVACFMKGVG